MWWTNFICSLLVALGMNSVVGWTADQVELCWDAPVLNADGTECTDLAGYNVYVTAHDLSGNESQPSNTINYTDGVYSCGSGAQNLTIK